MSQVLSGVTQKIQDLLPGQIGDNLRWSTADLERHIMLADRAVRERTENHWHRQDILLTDGTAEYTLDSEFIEVVSVEFSSDGSTFDWFLYPAVLSDLDKINVGWRSDGGTRPTHYVVLSAPGLPTAKIQIYRPIATVGGQKIRVGGPGIGLTTTNVPDDVQGKCHVPYVMSILMASQDPNMAADWFGKYLGGCDEVRARTLSRGPTGRDKVRAGW